MLSPCISRSLLPSHLQEACLEGCQQRHWTKPCGPDTPNLGGYVRTQISWLQLACHALRAGCNRCPGVQVYKAFLSGVEPVALKVVGGSAAENTDDGIMRAMRELSLLKDCRNPNIVQFLGACLWQGKVGAYL